MPELDGMSQACLYDTHIGVELRTCKEPGCTCVCHPVTDDQAVPLPPDALALAEDIICNWRHCNITYPGSLARTVLAAAAPAIRAQALADAHLVPDTLTDETRRDALAEGARTERAKLTAVISPDQFRKLADWFDADDEFKEAMFPETWSPGDRQDDVQRDLRKLADLLDGQP